MAGSASQLARAWKVLRTALRHRLDLLVPHSDLPLRRIRWPLAVLNRLLPQPSNSRGVRLRQALTELGPVYIKLGQLLSTRRDLLPADVADELALLQDQVPPITDFSVHDFVTAALGRPVAEVFSTLEPEPLASASVAQVHCGHLVSGEEVVVKLVRPGIESAIKEDMALLKGVAERVERWVPSAERLHLPRVAEDHERVLLGELDMFAEARNQIRLRRNFADSDLLYVPRVYAQHTRSNLLVMERIHGIPIGNVDELRDLGVDMQRLAHKGVETFFKQVWEHNFFHADMHPGNIFIDVTDPANPRYIALDCAIIGSLTEEDQRYLAQNLVAFFARDYKEIVDLHLESGWVPPETDPLAFEAVIREVCEPIFAKPLADISFGEFVVTLFRTAGEFNMEIQPQLVLLQKTLLYIEGLGRQLYPELDLWQTAQPFMQRWVAERMGPAAAIRDALAHGPDFWAKLLRLPATLEANALSVQRLRAQAARQERAIARIETRLVRQQTGKRLKRGAGVALVAGSVWLLWQPLAQGVGAGDMTMLAGVASALLGSALIVKA